MIKLVYCITRRPDLSHAEFSRYWRDVHAPIGAKIPGLRKLVQSHTIRTDMGGDGLPAADYDGMAELWFDDLASLLAARASPEWAASTANEKNFADEKRVALFVAEEHRIL